MQKRAKNKVPKDFQALMPSINVTDLDPKIDKYFIISSILKISTVQSWQWLFKTYTQNEVIEIIKNDSSLQPKDIMFWSYYFNIHKKDIACLQKKSQKTYKTHWKY